MAASIDVEQSCYAIRGERMQHAPHVPALETSKEKEGENPPQSPPTSPARSAHGPQHATQRRRLTKKIFLTCVVTRDNKILCFRDRLHRTVQSTVASPSQHSAARYSPASLAVCVRTCSQIKRQRGDQEIDPHATRWLAGSPGPVLRCLLLACGL